MKPQVVPYSETQKFVTNGVATKIQCTVLKNNLLGKKQEFRIRQESVIETTQCPEILKNWK